MYSDREQHRDRGDATYQGVMSNQVIIDELSTALASEKVLTSPETMAGFLVDWMGVLQGNALAVVRPSSTAEVAAVLRICASHGVSVTPQGGNTGLVGGSVPASNAECSVVLSTTGLNQIGELDELSGQVTVGAGVTLADLHAFARSHGLEYGVDLAARDSATIGGTVATNAGGIHVVKHGMTRRQIVGLEAVLPTGEVLSTLKGLTKDNTGYDLTQLLCGSEGTLAVITRVKVQLHAPQPTELLVFGVDTVSDALRIAGTFVGQVAAAEIIDRVSIESVSRVTGIPIPFDSAFHLLLEVTGSLDLDALTGFDKLVGAADAADRERLWSLRERITEASAVEAVGVTHKLDISFPQASLDAAYRALQALLNRPGVSKVAIFGHLLDGNYHLFFETESDDHDIDREVLELVTNLGGSISAEHGVGRMKAEYLNLSRSAVEIATMRAVKEAIDPLGIMNPGVIFT